MSRNLLGLALLACATAHGAEWDFSYRPPLTAETFQPFTFSDFRPSGSWAAGYAGGFPVLARFDPGGALLAYGTSNTYQQYLTTLPDGGVIAVGAFSFTQFCDVVRYDTGARARWTQPAASCDAAQVDGAGGIWSLARQAEVLRYAADGTRTLEVPAVGMRSLALSALAADPSGPAAYIAGNAPTSPFLTSDRAVVERLDRAGATGWRWVDPELQLSRALEVTVTSDGAVFASGDISVGEDTRLIGIKLSADGTLLRFERSTELVSVLEEFGNPGTAYSLRAGNDGSAYVLAHRIGEPLGAQSLVRFDATGHIAWVRSLDGWFCECRSEPTPDGGIALLLYHDAQGNVPSSIAIRRFTSDGVGSDEAFPEFHRFDLGRALATGQRVSLAWTIPAQGSPTLDASAQDDQGDTYVLTHAGGPQHLEKIDSAGNVVWSQSMTVDALWGDLLVTSDGACVLSIPGNPEDRLPAELRCFDIGSGALRGSATVPGSVFPSLFSRDSMPTPPAPLPLVLLRAEHGFSLYQPVAGAGGPIYTRDQFDYECRERDSLGRVLLVGRDRVLSAKRALLFDPDGGLRYEAGVPDDVCQNAGRIGLILPDGSALLVGYDYAHVPNVPSLTLLDADGGVRWHKQLDGAFNWNWSAAAQDAVFVAECPINAGGPSMVTTRVLKLALTDGAELWRREITERSSANPRIWFDPDSNRLLFASPAGLGVAFTSIDAASGAVGATATRSCGGPWCDLARSELDALGRLQLEARLDPFYGQGKSALFRIDHPFDVAVTYARVDQPALEGVWYSPASTGQGLVLDYIDAAHTAFLSWFTFTPGGGIAAGEQRWYTLQGAVPSGAGTVALGIYQNQGGRFASPPGTSAQLVGQAELSFPTCDTAVLSYAFDAAANDGASGTLGLVPITPPGGGCAPLGAPPAGSAQSANGFNTGQSGTWYDAASSGQGFSFVVRPGSQGGYLFGAWYTYDPVGSADDPTAQHWFTLQGDLAAASNGAVALTISRTIGGAFDYGPTHDTYRVGTATLQVSGCGSATLDYQFDATEAAAAFAGLSGHLNLTGLGTCVP